MTNLRLRSTGNVTCFPETREVCYCFSAFPSKNCKLQLAQPSWACQRSPTEKATKLFMTHKSVRESRGPSVRWSHRFFHCLAIYFFFCCMSFSHTRHITCIGLPPLIQTWKAVENSRRVQRHLLLLQGNSYKTFQSIHRRKWFPKSHNSGWRTSMQYAYCVVR